MKVVSAAPLLPRSSFSTWTSSSWPLAIASWILASRPVGAFAEVLPRDFLERQEAVAVLAVVDETGFERRLDPRHHRLVDVALALLTAFDFGLEVHQLLAVDDRQAALLGLRRIDQHAFHVLSFRRGSGRAASLPLPESPAAAPRRTRYAEEPEGIALWCGLAVVSTAQSHPARRDSAQAAAAGRPASTTAEARVAPANPFERSAAALQAGGWPGQSARRARGGRVPPEFTGRERQHHRARTDEVCTAPLKRYRPWNTLGVGSFVVLFRTGPWAAASLEEPRPPHAPLRCITCAGARPATASSRSRGGKLCKINYLPQRRGPAHYRAQSRHPTPRRNVRGTARRPAARRCARTRGSPAHGRRGLGRPAARQLPDAAAQGRAEDACLPGDPQWRGAGQPRSCGGRYPAGDRRRGARAAGAHGRRRDPAGGAGARVPRGLRGRPSARHRQACRRGGARWQRRQLGRDRAAAAGAARCAVSRAGAPARQGDIGAAADRQAALGADGAAGAIPQPRWRVADPEDLRGAGRRKLAGQPQGDRRGAAQDDRQRRRAPCAHRCRGPSGRAALDHAGAHCRKLRALHACST